MAKVPLQARPTGYALSYYQALRPIIKSAKNLVDRFVVPKLKKVRTDAESGIEGIPDTAVDLTVPDLANGFFKAFSDDTLATLPRKAGIGLSRFQKMQFMRQVQAALGVQPQLAEPWLDAKIEEFTKRNVALIKTIPQNYFDRVSQAVTEGNLAGRRPDDIEDDLDDIYEAADNHGLLIAKDQSNKFFADLNETRQIALGVEEYDWIGVEDERERDSHVDLEGTRHSWDDPPEVDGEAANPGEPILCRCQAFPVFDDLVEAFKNDKPVGARFGTRGDAGPEDEPRDEKGRWTSGGSGGVGGALQRSIAGSVKNGGATIAPASGALVTSGYAVSTERGLEKQVPAADFEKNPATHVLDYMAANREALAKPGAVLGLWQDSGKYFIDVSMVEPDREKAMALGRANDQLAIFDLGKGETVTLTTSRESDKGGP